MKKKKFPGFPKEPASNYWRYPMALNGYWHLLTGSEQKILDYILRHTWGFKKTQDVISYRQFMKGIRKKDGKWFDKGTGLSEATISKALKGLEKKEFVEIMRSKDERGKQKINAYRLKFLKSEIELKPTLEIKIRKLKSNNIYKDNNKRYNNKQQKTGSFSKMDELLGRKKERHTAYEWQDHALRAWDKIGYNSAPPKTWFRLFKLAYQKKQEGILEMTLSNVIDAEVDNKERYFYWKFNDLLKRRKK